MEFLNNNKNITDVVDLLWRRRGGKNNNNTVIKHYEPPRRHIIVSYYCRSKNISHDQPSERSRAYKTTFSSALVLDFRKQRKFLKQAPPQLGHRSLVSSFFYAVECWVNTVNSRRQWWRSHKTSQEVVSTCGHQTKQRSSAPISREEW